MNTSSTQPPALSVLDLVPVGTGFSASEALRNSEQLAQLVDRLGFTRLWYAEHHGIPSIASSAPELLIAHMCGLTQRIRVGSGGIMMQNHVPLKLAESFHTLEALHAGRIDLGIGRAPGTDPNTSRALRPFRPDQFAEQFAELRALSMQSFPLDHPFYSVRVVPSGVALPPIWLLGSSGASAHFAGTAGVGYSFASHFSPAPAAPAFSEYRASFQPSAQFPAPHAILAMSVICAESDDEANYLASTGDLMWVRARRGEFAPLPSPEEALAYRYTPEERALAKGYRDLALFGGPATVRSGILEALAESGADEVMVTTMVYDHHARLRSYELVADVMGLVAM